MTLMNQGGGGRNTTRDVTSWPAVLIASHPFAGSPPSGDPQSVFPRVYSWRPTFQHTPQRDELVTIITTFGPLVTCTPGLDVEWGRAWNISELYAIKSGYHFEPLVLPMPVIMSRGLPRDIISASPCIIPPVTDPQLTTDKLPVWFSHWQDPGSRKCDLFPV